jgi:hypothetical protein
MSAPAAQLSHEATASLPRHAPDFHSTMVISVAYVLKQMRHFQK